MTAGYSGTPLVKKLGIKFGIKEGFKLYVKNAPNNYAQLISPLPESVKITQRLTNELDMVHFFVKRKVDLIAGVEKQRLRIKQAGMIWISWPKKSSKVPTDITEDTIRDVILPMGLVDIK